MKSNREHRVPLSPRTLEILDGVPTDDYKTGYVFVSGRSGSPLSDLSLLAVLRRMGRRDLTVHGFRSSFRDWAGDQTNFPRDVAEAALAHVIADETEAAYRRGDALGKRRRLMTAWAGYCESAVGDRGRVLRMVRGS
jgi:integrase